MSDLSSKPRLRILQVEDDENDVLIVRHVVEKSLPGVAISVARDGEEAQAYLSGREPFGDRVKYPLPELVLMDLKLPRMTGLEVAQWMKSRPDLRDIPVFIMSSSAQDNDMERANRLGVSGYLVKKASLKGLAEALARIITDRFRIHP